MPKIINPMKKFTFILILCFQISVVLAEKPKSNYPQFSWDKLPVCIHLSNGMDDFTDEQIDFMSRFPLVCIEKNQAYRKYGSMEEGTVSAAKAIKKANNKTKVLFYWNSRIDYGEFYKHGEILKDKPEWAMKDQRGNYVTVQNNKRRTYDVTNPDFRTWWNSVPLKWVSEKCIDGVFVDAVLQYIAKPEYKIRQFGQQRFADIENSLYTMLTELQTKIPDDKIIIGNFLRGDKTAVDDMGLHFMQYMDGGMLEHFGALSGADKEIIANDIELIWKASQMGKIVVVKGWPRFNFTEPEKYQSLSDAEREKIAKEDIVFPLACFLIGAGEYSYFCYSWGYRDTEGGLIDYPEYNKPLGKPLNKYEKEGWVYTRSFEHADVMVDVEKRVAKIDWK